MKLQSTGFSLIEIVVAITIGGIILATVMGSFLTLSKMSQQLDLTRQIQRELNFATIRIADRIRSQSIDYSRLDELDHHFLPIGGSETFRFDEDAGMLFMNDAPLFSNTLMVRDSTFLVFPEDESEKLQPRVQIELRVTERTEGNITPKISIPLRTTLSSRIIQ
jgi:prepilin-type N-terminal cleavage/methylation domain-containing protein